MAKSRWHSDLAAEFGTPLLVYSQDRLIANAEAVAQAFGHAPADPRVFFPVKACYLGVVLQALAAYGLGAEVQSELELRLALRAGFPPARVVWNGPGKTARELQLALETGVRAIHVESAEELLTLSRLARGQSRPAPIGIRVQRALAGSAAPFAQPGWKFGADIASGDALSLIDLALAQPDLRLKGLHVHTCARQTSACCHLGELAALVELGRQVHRRHGWTPAYLDLGGGFAPRSDLISHGTELTAIASALMEGGTPIWVEPGRLLVGDAAVVLTRVIREKVNSGRRWLLTDATTSLLVPGPFSQYPVAPVCPADGPSVTTAVGDGLCIPQGVINPAAELPRAVTTGALLEIGEAGAYTLSFSSGFGSPGPAVLLAHGEQVRLVQKRLSPAELSESWFVQP